MKSKKLQQVDRCHIDALNTLLANQSAEEVQHRLGIGINTWQKLRRGEAIRPSVAARLIERAQTAQAQ
jgi:hypothetical protein